MQNKFTVKEQVVKGANWKKKSQVIKLVAGSGDYSTDEAYSIENTDEENQEPVVETVRIDSQGLVQVQAQDQAPMAIMAIDRTSEVENPQDGEKEEESKAVTEAHTSSFPEIKTNFTNNDRSGEKMVRTAEVSPYGIFPNLEGQSHLELHPYEQASFGQ